MKKLRKFKKNQKKSLKPRPTVKEPSSSISLNQNLIQRKKFKNRHCKQNKFKNQSSTCLQSSWWNRQKSSLKAVI